VETKSFKFHGSSSAHREQNVTSTEQLIDVAGREMDMELITITPSIKLGMKTYKIHTSGLLWLSNG
jgi:hypothetical protein